MKGDNTMTQTKEFKRDEVIFREGDWQMTMYAVRSGKVGIYANYGNANEQLLTTLEAGKFFGEMGLIEARTRSATAVALTNRVTVEEIDGDGFNAFFESQPEKIVEILVNMTNRLRELSDEYVNACDTICEYVATEKEKKPGFWKRIKSLFIVSEEEGKLMQQAMLDSMIWAGHPYYTY